MESPSFPALRARSEGGEDVKTRAIDRRMEHRCDRVAGRFVDPLAGIVALQAVDAHWERPSRLFVATHPPTYDRIARLSTLAARTH